MQSITIRKVAPSDLPEVAELAAIIWREHYTPIIGSEQVEYMLEKFQSVPAMAKQISEGVSYYCIVLDGDCVGYLSFYLKEDALFLSKIYVSSQLRGQGIGRQAMQFVMEQAQLQGLAKVQLTVNKYNSGSIAAYHRMGFVTVEELVMDIGSGFVMDDYLMQLFVENHE